MFTSSSMKHPVTSPSLLCSSLLCLAACGPSTASEGEGGDESTETGETGEPGGALISGCERIEGGADGQLWSLRCGGPGREELRDVAIDASGNVHVALEVDYSALEAEPIELGNGVSFEGEGESAVLVSFDAAGEARWAQQFAGASLEFLGACGEGVVIVLEQAAGLDLGTGPIVDEGVLAVLDGEGELRWLRAGDYRDAWIRDAHCNATGELALAMLLAEPLDFGGGEIGESTNQGVVVRYAADGEFVWNRSFESEQPSAASGVRLRDDGELILTGDIEGSSVFGELEPPLLPDAIIARYDAAGELLWATQFGPSVSEQFGAAVALGPEGEFSVGGSFVTDIEIDGVWYPNTVDTEEPEFMTHDAFVVTMSAEGEVGRVQLHGGGGNERVAALGYDESGRLVTAYGGALDFAIYDGDAQVWSWSWSSGLDGVPVHMAVSDTGEMAYASVVDEVEIDLGGGALAPHGREDLILTRLTP